MKISIIGAGSWGTTLGVLAQSAGHRVALWARSAPLVRQLNHRRKSPYLKGITLPPGLRATTDLKDAVEGAELVLLAIPSHGMRGVAEKLAPVARNKPLLSVTKGIELQTHQRMSEVIAEVIGDNDYAVLSGPSFAHDVARMKPTAVVVASARARWAEQIQKNLSGPTLRLYTSSDVAGVELGGALKNVMAVAAGVSDGLGLAESSRAALITRGLAELVRLGETLGGKRETFFGLSGLGDLVLTCSSHQSRNHRAGEMLAKGKTREKIAAAIDGVAEGIHNAKSFHQIASEQKVDAPIIRATYGMLYEGVTPARALESLMGRGLKKE